MTTVLSPGVGGPRYYLVVVGDGFSAGEQEAFNEWVDTSLLGGVFGSGLLWEDAHAFRVDRVNLTSNDPGVSTRTYDQAGNVTAEVIRDTRFGFIYNGVWTQAWIEPSPDSFSRLHDALSRWTPGWDRCLVVVNNPGFGGVAYPGIGVQLVTRGSGWPVTAHEFGHGLGNLADEYCTPNAAPPGPEPLRVNVTRNSDRATLKWRRFVDPATPVPTGVGPCVGYTEGPIPPTWNTSDDAGVFEGASYYSTGMFRPVVNCRMRSNGPPFCPVCYTEMRDINSDYVSRDLSNFVLGDFSGDGRDDLVVHTGRSLGIYRAGAPGFAQVFHSLYPLHESWDLRPTDKMWAADFDGDSRDEVLLYDNTTLRWLVILRDDGRDGLHAVWAKNWRLGNWYFGSADEFIPIDYDGDGRKDVLLVNRVGYPSVKLGVAHSDGVGFRLVRVYSGALPDWELRPADEFLVADVNGDGNEELIVINRSDWSVPYLGVFSWQSTGFVQLRRHNGWIGDWEMRQGDQFLAADFDGDGSRELYVVNALDWAIPYLGILKYSVGGFAQLLRFETVVGAWQLGPGDSYAVVAAAGSALEGLVALNASDWPERRLGILFSDATTLAGVTINDMVGDWALDPTDQIRACRFDGGSARAHFVLQRGADLSLFRVENQPSQLRHYRSWIHDYRYGRNQ